MHNAIVRCTTVTTMLLEVVAPSNHGPNTKKRVVEKVHRRAKTSYHQSTIASFAIVRITMGTNSCKEL